MKQLLICIGVAILCAYVKPGLLGNAPSVKIKVNYVKMCPDHLEVPSTYDDLTMILDPETNILYISGVLNMKEDILPGANLSLDFRKCYNEKASSCEKYVVTEVEDFCQYLPEPNKTWSFFVQRLENMKGECPIPAGSYKITEAPVDLSDFQNFTDFIGHWQIEFAFKTTKKMIGCLMVDVDVTLSRKG